MDRANNPRTGGINNQDTDFFFNKFGLSHPIFSVQKWTRPHLPPRRAMPRLRRLFRTITHLAGFTEEMVTKATHPTDSEWAFPYFAFVDMVEL